MLASLSLWPDSRKTPRSMGPDTKIAVNPERVQGPDTKKLQISGEKNRRKTGPVVISGKVKVGPQAPLSQRHQVEPTSGTRTASPLV